MTVTIAQDTAGLFQVRAPYSQEFPADARKLGGWWNRDRELWLFDHRRTNYHDVLDILEQNYPDEDIEEIKKPVMPVREATEYDLITRIHFGDDVTWVVGWDNPSFSRAAKAANGVWNFKHCAWRFDATRMSAGDVVALVEQHYDAVVTLESDVPPERKDVVVYETSDGGGARIASPYNKDFVAAAKAAGGRWSSSRRVWEFPDRSKTEVAELARQHFEDVHFEEQTLPAPRRSAAPCTITRTDSGAVWVRAPYNEAFVAAARELGGKWDRGLEHWSFEDTTPDKIEDILQAANRAYARVVGLEVVTGQGAEDEKSK